MKLEGSFYKTQATECTEQGFRSLLILSADHEVYKGHFPEHAIVPGVFTLTIIRECLSQHLGRDVHFKTIKECKFVSAIEPREGLTLRLDMQCSNLPSVQCTAVCDDRTVLKLKAEIL